MIPEAVWVTNPSLLFIGVAVVAIAIQLKNHRYIREYPIRPQELLRLAGEIEGLSILVHLPRWWRWKYRYHVTVDGLNLYAVSAKALQFPDSVRLILADE